MFSTWLGLGGSGIPNFNFVAGDEVAQVEAVSGVRWSVKKGSATDDSAPCTIFCLTLAPGDANSTAGELGRNALKKAKTLMLPGFLKCLGAAEHKDTLYVATEPCVPLRSALTDRETYYGSDDATFHEGVALGLHTIASALKSLHCNGLAHYNVNSESIFVTPSGEWRLYGTELVDRCDDEHSLYHRYKTCCAPHRVPPGQDSSASVDSWGLGCLAYEVFTSQDPRTITQADLRSVKHAPRKLQSAVTGLFATSPSMRWTMVKFLTQSTFVTESAYVRDLIELGELSLRDATDRDSFFRRLCQGVDSYPLQACKLLILPKLNSSVQFGGSSAAVLEPLLKIGSRLSPDDFATHVSPSVVTLFASSEQIIRYRLLTSAQEYASLLPAALVCDKIWPHYATGFVHRSPDIRELSVRALVHFAEHLNEKLLTGDVMKFITQLQTDREGPIRTNSTICLGMIAKYLPEAQRAKLLLNGFGRMLKDPFLPSRLAAVRSVASTLEYYAPEQMAQQIIPALAPMALDGEEEVRKTAVKALKAMITSVETQAKAMPKSAAEEKEREKQKEESGSNAGTTPQQTPPATPNASTSSAPASGDAKPRSWFGGWGSRSSVPDLDTTPPPEAPAAKPSSVETSSEAPTQAENPAPRANNSFNAASEAPEPVARPATIGGARHADPAPSARAGGGESPTAASPAPRSGMKLRKKGGLAASKVE